MILRETAAIYEMLNRFLFEYCLKLSFFFIPSDTRKKKELEQNV